VFDEFMKAQNQIFPPSPILKQAKRVKITKSTSRVQMLAKQTKKKIKKMRRFPRKQTLRNFKRNPQSSGKYQQIDLHVMSLNETNLNVNTTQTTTSITKQQQQETNSLHLGKLDCEELMNDLGQVVLIRRMLKQSRDRLQVECASENQFWKSFLGNFPPG